MSASCSATDDVRGMRGEGLKTVKGSEEDAEKHKINYEFYTMTDDEEYFCEIPCQECDTAPEISEINGMCAL